ncbi:helix-turn-helix domain-containing protein [Weissella confusa]|uniref:helix-turn-helix domain-containing protein n=1 Tax=Weissella confusa TaxID=1583 RepID=UPI0018F1335A|nr:helix-turn-helix transcriptional regulator [Weissella confusa]MBJ7686983.1 helix-turn-helix transcriptional regulator [Weissella confusa]MBJ7697458.1 helix-turn-helix transcriptional regulator [Weissella confusa]
MKIIFSEQLAKLRKAKGFSQETLAQKLFMTRQAISKWETGEATPDLEKIQLIAEALDVTAEDLLFGQHKTKLSDKFSDMLQSDEGDQEWHERHKWREWQYSPIANFWEFMARYWWIVIAFIWSIGWLINAFKN